MDLGQDLVLVGIGPQVVQFLALVDGAAHGGVPDADRLHQRVAHGADVVVELDRAADVDAARVQLDGGALHPVVEQGAQTGQPALGLQRGIEHLLLEAVVVLADHGNLQLFAGAEMGKHTGFAHLRGFGQATDRQAFQPVVHGQLQGHIHDVGLGLQAFGGNAVPRCRAARFTIGGRAAGDGGENVWGRGHASPIKTNVRSFLDRKNFLGL